MASIIFTNVIHFVLLYYLCTSVFDKNNKSYMKYVFILCLIIKSCSIFYQDRYINLSFAIITYLCFIMLYNYGNNKKFFLLNIFWLVIFYSVTIFAETLSVIIIKLYTGYSVEIIVTSPFALFLANAMASICKIVVIYTLCMIYKIKTYLPNLCIHMLLIALPISLVAIILCVDPIIREGTRNIAFSISLIAFMFAIVLTVYVLNYLLKQERALSERKLEEAKLHIDQLYYQHLNSKMEEVRAFKHDMLTQLNMIKMLAIQNNESAINYLNELTDQLNNTVISYTDNSLLDTILNSFSNKIDASNIKLTCRSFKDLDISWISPIDLTCILGNIFENAIYSCEHSKDKNIYFVIDKSNDYLIMKIVNSCDKVIKVNNSFSSLKRNGRVSYGLENVERCAKKYNAKVSFKFDEQNREFKTTIILPREKSSI